MDSRRDGVCNGTALTALVVTALALRLAAVLWSAAPTDRPTTYEHGEIADNLLAGRGFTVRFLGGEGPTSQQAPWVPLLLAACALPYGHVTPAAVFTFQLLQCFAGAALVVAVARAAWGWFPERRGIGWAAAWAAAFYPPYVYMATHVQAAPWAALALATLFALVADARDLSRPRTPVLFGLTAGWLLLIDPIYLLVLPIVGWRLFAAPPAATLGRRRCVGVAAACTAVVVAPWLVRNRAVHGEFVFVKSTFGYAFWQGNNALSWGTDKIPKPTVAAAADDHDGSLAGRHRALWEARHETLYIDDVLLKPNGYREFAGLSEPQRSQLLGRQAWQHVVEAPQEYASRCLRRLRYFLLWDETNPKAMSLAYRASSAVWLTLSAIGLLAARRRWSVLAPSMLVFLVVMLFHVLTITSARFRIPLESLGLLWGAVGLEPAAANLAAHVRLAWRAARDSAASSQAAPSGSHRGAGLTGPHLRQATHHSRRIARRR